MSRQRLVALAAIAIVGALSLGLAAHAFALDAPGAAEGAPSRPRFEGRRVPMEPAVQLSLAPTASAEAPPPPPTVRHAPPAPSSIASAYDSCRRSFYERGLPYDFLACGDQPRAGP